MSDMNVYDSVSEPEVYVRTSPSSPVSSVSTNACGKTEEVPLETLFSEAQSYAQLFERHTLIQQEYLVQKEKLEKEKQKLYLKIQNGYEMPEICEWFESVSDSDIPDIEDLDKYLFDRDQRPRQFDPELTLQEDASYEIQSWRNAYEDDISSYDSNPGYGWWSGIPDSSARLHLFGEAPSDDMGDEQMPLWRVFRQTYMQVRDRSEGTFTNVYTWILKKLGFTMPSVLEGIRLVESLLLFVEDVKTNPTSKTHMSLAIWRLLKMSGVSSVDVIIKAGDYLVQQIYSLLYSDFCIQSDTADYFVWLKDFIDGKEMIENSVFMKKTQSLFARLVAMGLFPQWEVDLQEHFPEISKFVSELERRPLKGGVDFIFSLCDYVVFVGTKGMEACHSGVWNTFFGEKSGIIAWIERVEKLRIQSNFFSDPQVLVLAGYVTDTIDITVINSECSSLLEQGQVYLQNKRNLHKREFESIMRCMNDLGNIRVMLTSTKFTMRSRPMPFGLILHGRSSVMKTYLTRLFYQLFARAANSIEWENKPKMNLVADDEHFYSRNPNDEYWSKFKSNMWCINFDDVGGIKPAIAQGVPTDIASFLRVQNNTPYVTEQAAVEDKGKIPVQNLLTIGSTNVFHLDVPMYMNDSFANLRRFHMYVDVEIKSEYSDATGQCVDTSKIPTDSNLLNLWNFTVRKAVPNYKNELTQRVNVPAKFEVVAEFDDINDMMAFYCQSVISHLKQQERALSSSDKLAELNICDTCFRNLCTCTQVQSDYDTVQCLWSIWMIILIACVRILGTSIFYLLRILPSWIPVPRPHYATEIVVLKFMYWRWRLHRWWRDFKFNIKWGKIIAILAMIVATSCVVMRIRRRNKKTYKPQGETGSKPLPEGDIDEKENPWVKEELELSSLDLTPHINSWNGRSIESFVNTIQNNVLYVHFIDKFGDVRRGRMLGIGGQLYATNNHYFILNQIAAVKVIRSNQEDGVSSSRVERIESEQLFVMKERDLAFVYLPNQPPMKNISKYFIDSLNLRFFGGATVVRAEDRLIDIRDICGGHLEKNVKVHDPSMPAMSGTFDLYFGRANKEFSAGECGSPLIMEIAHSGFCIAGLHMVTRITGSTKHVGSVPIIRSWVEEAIKHFGHLSEPGPVLLNSATAPNVKLGKLHFKSPLHWIQQGDCEIYGSIPERAKPKSKVVETAIGDELIRRTRDETFPIHRLVGPPVMGFDWRPKRIALMDCVNTNCSINYNILRKCVEAYWFDIQTELPTKEWDLIQEYDMFTAINGAAGVKYVDKMNRKTSAGFPWCTSKKKFLVPMEPMHGLQEPVDITDEIKERVAQMDSQLRAGVRAMPVFNSQLKDEPVSFSKIEKGKTRVFSSAPMDFTILVRKYLLSCVRVIQRNIYVFEAAPGVNAHSLEWEEIYKYLTTWGTDRIIAGDYSAFDKTMPPIMITMAFEILARMCEKGGFSAEALTAVRTLGQDISFPLTNFFGDIVQFHGSNPSGHPLTVIVNSIANSLYMRYAYYILNPAKECTSFRSNVRLLTYGDDNICGVAPECDFFTHTGVQAALSEIDIKYTMADKEAQSVPYININDASFLKRRFCYSASVGAVVARLEHDSISKMLTTCVKSKGLTLEQHSMEVMRAALTEYFFYPPELFERRRELFRSIFHAHRMQDMVEFERVMPTWNDLFRRFWGPLPVDEIDGRANE